MFILERASVFNTLFQVGHKKMDQSKLYIPTPQKFIDFYMDDAKGQRKRKPLTFMDGEKPTSEKMRTELVSPTERSLEQVADRLKRKRKRSIKKRSGFKSRQKSSSTRRNKSIKGLKISKNKRAQKKKIKSKGRAKDIFN